MPAGPPGQPQALRPGSARVVLVDLQTSLRDAASGGDRAAARAALLVNGAAALGVPVTVTEQAPAKLGGTDAAVAAAAGVDPVAKTAFGAAGALGLTDALADDRHQIVLAGLETHVCVARTAVELLAAGYAVSVCADACASRSELDHAVALDRLRGEGAVVTTVEAVLFEWLRTSEHPRFREISKLVKAAGPA